MDENVCTLTLEQVYEKASGFALISRVYDRDNITLTFLNIGMPKEDWHVYQSTDRGITYTKVEKNSDDT